MELTNIYYIVNIYNMHLGHSPKAREARPRTRRKPTCHCAAYAGSDDRILIQEIFEPKLLSTFETHAPVYAAEKQVGVVLDILCIGAYPCSSILLLLISHSSGAHMVNFATLSTCLDLEVPRLPQFRRQLLQPSCTWMAVLSAYQHILAVNADGEIGKFDPTSTALRAVTLKRKD